MCEHLVAIEAKRLTQLKVLMANKKSYNLTTI